LSGRAFEQALYKDLLYAPAHRWQHASGPGQLDMGLLSTSRTGLRYEFDGVFGADDTLYIVEAKRLRGRLTRELIGIFVQKLLDSVLGSDEAIGHLRIQPVVVSRFPHVDDAAYRLAVAWGILLISPDRPTPFEIIHHIQTHQVSGTAASRLMHDCEILGPDLWRSFNRFVATSGNILRMYSLDPTSIHDAQHTAELIEQWTECGERALEPVMNSR
jgi:hypothetical protein